MPWLFLREPFGVMVTQSTMRDLTDESRSLIQDRQRWLSRIAEWWFVFSLVSIISGTVTASLGLYFWRSKVQQLHNEQLRIETQKKRIELENLTGPEVILAAAQDSAEVIEPTLEMPRVPPQPSMGVGRYLHLEMGFGDKLRLCMSDTHDLEPYKRSGMERFDFVMYARNDLAPDYLVEIKLSRRHLSTINIIDTMLAYAVSTRDFSARRQRETRLVLFFVMAQDHRAEIENPRLREGFEQARCIHPTVSVYFVPQALFEGSDCNQLVTWLQSSPAIYFASPSQ